MTVTDSDLRRLRKMVVEPTEVNYTDEDLTTMIEDTACRDSTGKDPDDSDWTATYNIFKVASEIWIEKAAQVANEFDFNADGGSFSRSQKQMMALKQASYYESRSKALSLQMKQEPMTHLADTRWQDLPYKDEIDDYESNLV